MAAPQKSAIFITGGVMAKEERIVPAISEQRMKLQDNRRNTWFFDVPVGVTPDDLQEPKFWAHVSRKLRQCD